jgi:uncharacterized protein YgiM (DUF1202 family)
VKSLFAVSLLLAALPAMAQTYYVTERLEVGVFAQPTLDGDRVAVLHSAEAVEVIGREGNAAMVRLGDGSEGWISSSYLDSALPLASRLETLTAENDRLRAATRAETGADTELKNLQSRNSELEKQLASARREAETLQVKSVVPAAKRDDEIPVETVRPPSNNRVYLIAWIVVGIALALALGFWWGYRTLEQRVRRKYGGLKVY